MNYLYDHSKITFASCWGFQAMAKARGGEVIHDLEQAELGTTKLWLTNEGKKDKIFQHLPHTFLAQMGHEDIVKTLPLDAILLASSEKVKNEAFTFKKKPIYCTQFHPELNKNDFIKRMTRYPEYLEKILGISKMEFINKRCKNSKDTNKLILRFLQEHVN
jgi:GMP synthase (glutamine-hydrolysing)